MQDSIQKDFYFVKSQVQASYSQRTYNTTVTLSQNIGIVKEGTCNCLGSGLGRCAHVAAVLFAIEDFIDNFGNEPATCTEKLCEWNKGRRKNKKPSAVYEIKYPSMSKEISRPRKSGDFIFKSDPRPASIRKNDISQKEVNDFLSNLQTISGFEECGWTNLLDFEYSEFTVQEYGVEFLKSRCQEFQQNLKNVCENAKAPFCVNDTHDQAAASQWHANRWCRITASNAKAVSCLKTGHGGVLKSLLWSPEEKEIAALQYGKDNESNAFSAYADKNPAYKCETTGLWLNTKYPELGCSPDGIVTDGNISGLLEIKCPYILKNYCPNGCEENLSEKQRKNFFCSFLDDGSLILRKSHAYYYQIQMQLAICEKSFCDFVVWSPHGISVERIIPDNTMWKFLYPKLQKFHKEYLIPEYFLMRIPRDLPPFKFEY